MVPIPARQALMAIADEVIERHSGDLLGDTAFATAKSMLAFAELANLQARTDINDTLSFKASLRAATGKIFSAVSSWSAARSEEQWGDVQSILAQLLNCGMHSVSLAVKLITESIRPHMRECDSAVCDADALSAASKRTGENAAHTMMRNLGVKIDSLVGGVDLLISMSSECFDSLGDCLKRVGAAIKVSTECFGD